MYGKCVKSCIGDENTTYHRIPRTPDQRKAWMVSLNLPELTKGRVCSKHFVDNDFDVKLNGTVWLKKSACPMKCYETFEPNETDVEIELMDNESEVIRLDLNTIYKEHNYSKKTFPRSVKQIETAYRNRLLTMNIRRTLTRTRNLMQKLKSEHKREMKKFENFPTLSPLLQELVMILLKHNEKSSTPKHYTPDVRKFALSLHYYSPAGYQFVRSTLNNCLPHPKTIASWYKVIDGSPGFTAEALDALTELQNRTPYKIVTSLVLDGMAIRKHLQRVGSKTIGYSDCGGVLPEVDEKHQLAKESLIYLVVGVNVPFKIQVGYFLISSLTGKQLAYLTETGVCLVQNCNVVIGSVTHDGLRSQLLMDTLLGCDFTDVRHLVTYFKVNDQKIFVFPDMCHMIKLARNFVCDEFEFLDKYGRTVSWKFFVNLHRLQTSMGLHFANKVRGLHVNFRNQIMKVYLATQLFSSSVADAIEFLDETLKLPDFKCSQGTVEFVRVMNDVFDIFNSRQMTDTFYKQPLHKNNYKFIMERLDYAKEYLISLRDMNKKPIHAGPRYTFVVGILILIESLKQYYHEFVEKQKLLAFIPTYKQSQDSVEIFNCSMRSFHGYNTNPTAVTFQNAYKKSLLHVQFHEKFSGNCIPLESIPILNCTSVKKSAQKDLYISDEEFESSIENSIFVRGFKTNFDAYHSIIAHISGYIGRRLYTMLKCEQCSKSVIYEMSDKEHEDDEDHGYDDRMDIENSNEDIIFYDEFSTTAFRDDQELSGANLNINATMEGIALSDDYETQNFVIQDENDYSIDDEDVELNDSIDDEDIELNDSIDYENEIHHQGFDLKSADEIMKNYLNLIKKKDKGGLFYPSDTLYRITILADVVFTTALKQSGGKMLKKMFTLNRLVGLAHAVCHNYLHLFFRELKLHFEIEECDENSLIRTILRFYLRIRIDFLNKNVSANSGKRQQVLHSIHFQGM